jgi:hypothetical protein
MLKLNIKNGKLILFHLKEEVQLLLLLLKKLKDKKKIKLKKLNLIMVMEKKIIIIDCHIIIDSIYPINIYI